MKDLRYLTDSYEEGIRRIREIDAPLNFIYMADQHNRMNELSANRRDPDNPPPFELAADAIDYSGQMSEYFHGDLRRRHRG